MSDIIAAVSTGRVVSAIGIVRLSGPGSIPLAFSVFQARGSVTAETAEDRKLYLGSLYDARGNVLRSPGQQTGQSVPDEIGLGASYYPGGLTISAVDLAKLVSILAGDGMYNGEALLSPQSVEEMETVQFSVDPGDGTAPFDQCLILRRQEDLLGREELYYHTGSAYGVYALLSYDPNTGDGVVVLTTGAPRQVDDRGLYQLCARLSEQLYAAMEEHEA